VERANPATRALLLLLSARPGQAAAATRQSPRGAQGNDCR
jgi:hypothetical protein